jgi:hypothetical protein
MDNPEVIESMLMNGRLNTGRFAKFENAARAKYISCSMKINQREKAEYQQYIARQKAEEYRKWVTVQLDDRVSLDFPAQPKKEKDGSYAVWRYDMVPTASCIARVRDYTQEEINFTRDGRDSASMAARMEQLKTDILAEAEKSGDKLLSAKQGTIQGHTSIETVTDLGKYILYIKIILVGAKTYSLSFIGWKQQPQEAFRNQFLNSFKVK